MTLDEAVQRLANFTRSLPDFRIYEEHEIDRYDHMGAAIADAVLQAQRDYYSVVAPRTERILSRWPEAKTVSAVLECLQSVSASEFLDWKDTASSGNYLAHLVERFCETLKLFKENGIESITDLRGWLSTPANSARLSAIYGVGPCRWVNGNATDSRRPIVEKHTIVATGQRLESLKKTTPLERLFRRTRSTRDLRAAPPRQMPSSKR